MDRFKRLVAGTTVSSLGLHLLDCKTIVLYEANFHINNVAGDDCYSGEGTDYTAQRWEEYPVIGVGNFWIGE